MRIVIKANVVYVIKVIQMNRLFRFSRQFADSVKMRMWNERWRGKLGNSLSK